MTTASGCPASCSGMSLDRVAHPVHARFPASGRLYFQRLRHAGVFHDVVDLREDPLSRDGLVAMNRSWSLEARRLDHPVEAFGYRLVEPDGRRMLPDRLARMDITGPDVGRLQRAGFPGGRTVSLEEMSAPRPGQRVAFVMDTRMCDAVHALADGADLLAREYGHLTARQAGSVAQACGVRRLVLTHFSQRYGNPSRFRDEAAAVYDGEVVVAEDLMRVAVPARSAAGG